MQEFAIIEDGIIGRIIELPDDADAPEGGLPIVREADPTLGANQVLSAIIADIEPDRVVYRREARRALSGQVAIIEGGRVQDVRDLGPDLVQVADNALPVIDKLPTLAAGEVLGEVSYKVNKASVTRTWAVAKAPLPELEPYQFFAMLDLSGKAAALDVFIDALPSPQNIVARRKLEKALAFHRDNDLVLAAQQALGLTDEQLDALWLQAAAL